MPNPPTPQPAATLLENTVKNDLANDTTDTSVVRTLVNKTLNERQQNEGELSQDLVSRYEDWAYAVKELGFAEDAYDNAESDSDEEAEAEQEKNSAEQEVDEQARTLRQALADFLASK